MSISVTPHLNFKGDAREALEFYQTVFGGDVMVATYAEFGAPKDSPDADKVVFGQVAAASGFRVMAYDIPTVEKPEQPAAPTTRREYGMTITEDTFFVALRGDDTEEITAQWEKLSDGATIIEPLASSQWSPLFGMLTDRFGITWIIDVASDYSG